MTEREIIDDFEDEQNEIHDLLLSLSPDDWAKPTPSPGWDVKDQVSHLAHTEEVAHDTVTDGPRSLARETAKFTQPADFTEAGCDQGRTMTPEAVLDWWWQAAERNRAALRAADRSARVPWGLGMSWKAFCTARLMEHWAHTLDIRAAVGKPGTDTDRIRNVAWIGANAVGYAFNFAGITPPEGHSLRFDLTGPHGDLWTFGPADATDTITGPAGQWCRVAVQRMPASEATELKANGPLAELVLANARAFL